MLVMSLAVSYSTWRAFFFLYTVCYIILQYLMLNVDVLISSSPSLDLVPVDV